MPFKASTIKFKFDETRNFNSSGIVKDAKQKGNTPNDDPHEIVGKNYVSVGEDGSYNFTIVAIVIRKGKRVYTLADDSN